LSLDRYHRQYLLPQIGKEGQEQLTRSRAVVLGCGALGTHLASHLARAGVGFIRIVDRDFVELNNLQRQILFDEEDVRQNLPKAEAAKQKLERVNSAITIEAHVADVNYTNVETLINKVDLVVDGMDNFETRFLINDACVKQNIPWIYGGCIGTQGISMTILPGKTPCLRCVFESAPPPELSPTCDTAGVLGPAVAIIAALQATEALKYLSGNLEALDPNLFSFDTWTRHAQTLRVEGMRDKVDCPTCKHGQYDYLSGEKGSRGTSLCGRNAVQITREGGDPLDFELLADRLRPAAEVSYNKFLMKVRVDEHELTIFKDGRAIIQGTHDIQAAKSLYAKYVSV